MVSSNLPLQGVVVITVGDRELVTAVLHRGCIHRDTGVGHTCIGRNGHTIKQVGRFVLIVFGRKLDTVVEQCQVNTEVGGLLLLPGDVAIHEIFDGRTCHGIVAEAVGHVASAHRSLVHVFTDVLITQFTIAGAELEHIDDVAINGIEALLVETPTYGNRGEGVPTDSLGEARATITALMYGERQQAFARQKQGSLPRQCKECRFLFACHGECPKNRFLRDCYGEPFLNYLCAGYHQFFTHVAADMDFMRNELLHQRPPANIMKWKNGRTL